MTLPAAFTKRAGSGNTKPRLLVEITLTDPSARTIRLSYGHVGAAGVGYHGAIKDADPIEEPGQWLAQSYFQCSWGFTVLDVWTPGQPVGETFSKLLSAYRFRGAAIVVKEWDPTIGIGDAATMFVGQIDGYESRRPLITFDCVQRRDWNKVLDGDRVTRARWPRAPQKSVGAVIPRLIGRGAAQVLRGDFARTLGQNRNNFDHAGGGIPTSRGLIVDIGRGEGSGAQFEQARILVAAHALGSIGSGSAGTNFFGSNDLRRQPSVINPSTILNASTGAGFLMPNASGFHYLPVAATEVKTVANMAGNPRAVLDPADEASYAELDYDALKRVLSLALPSVPAQGRFVAAWIVFGYKSGASVGTLKFVWQGPSSSQLWAPLTNSTTFEAFVVDPSHLPSDPWNLEKCEIRCEFQGAAAGVSMRCHSLGVIFQYQPQVKTEYFRKLAVHPLAPDLVVDPYHPLFTKERLLPRVSLAEAVDEFYCNANGPVDDGSGTYTGTNGEQIERAPDIAHYLLRTYCGQSAGQIETGVGALGSFVDARAKLKTWNQRKMTHFLSIDTEIQARDCLERLGRDSVSAFHLGRTDGKARWTVFERDPAVTYRTIEPEDVIDPHLLKLRTPPDTSLMSSVRIGYLFDVFKQEFVGDAFASPSDSRSGYFYRGLRDESCTVVANESDRFDFVDTNGTWAATLTAAEYEPWDFAKHLAARMNAAATADYLVSHGPRVETGYNNKLDINDGADKTATIAQGSYASFEALCTAVAAALNAVSTNWTCTYNRTTLAVTIDRTAGTKTIRGSSGPNWATSILPTLGMSNISAAAPRSSQCEVEEERFAVGILNGTLTSIPLETGANGANATPPRTCGALIGLPIDRDIAIASGIHNFSGLSPKASREYVLKRARDQYGAQRPYNEQARTILDTDTARETRNRLIDLGAMPRPLVSFRSWRIRDLERYHVLQFSSRFDRWHGYTEEKTDGSWAGKKFWVISCRHFVGAKRWDSEAVLVRA